MQSFNFGKMGLAALVGLSLVTSCDAANKAVNGAKDVCDIHCPGDSDSKGVKVLGVADGNAHISGDIAIDGFFASVVNFNNAAASVSGGIEAQLDAIRADFELDPKLDVGTALQAKLDASLEGGVSGGLKIDLQPAQCTVDASATIEAEAKCDASVKPGMVSVDCKGKCEADVGAKLECSADAMLKCTATAPSVACSGECKGTCNVELMAAAKCDATCEGDCTGTCSLKNAAGKCAGKCDGMCTGSCKTELAASASCSGKCEGECTATPPSGSCDASAKASCEGMAHASVKCKGHCDADFEPPMAKAECQASAKADASVNVQCTPPQLKVDYKLAASLMGSANVDARAKFEVALKNLITLRLPALLEAAGRASFVARAGEGLATAADGAVKASLKGVATAGLSIKAGLGLTCAIQELPKVGDALSVASERLKTDISAAASVSGKLNIPG